MRLGIVGCGTIGTIIAKAVTERLSSRITLGGLCDAEESAAVALNKKLGLNIPLVPLDRLIGDNDFIVEAASAAAAEEIVRKSIFAGKGVMVMSSGGLIGHEDLFDAAEKCGAKIYVPSGALCGLDGIKSAAAAGIDSVTLTTRKPPKGLEGAPFILENGIDLSKITGETVLFEGSAREAVRAFPKNVNVSATLSLCGIGADRTKVRVITSPDYIGNSHEVEAVGVFGRLTAKTENVPSPDNPKTSYLAALSAIAALEGIVGNRVIGH